MPRNKKAKPGAKKRKKYEENEIQKAIDAIKCGLSVRKAEKKYNIPKSVLSRYMKKTNMKPKSNILNFDETNLFHFHPLIQVLCLFLSFIKAFSQ